MRKMMLYNSNLIKITTVVCNEVYKYFLFLLKLELSDMS